MGTPINISNCTHNDDGPFNIKHECTEAKRISYRRSSFGYIKNKMTISRWEHVQWRTDLHHWAHFVFTLDACWDFTHLRGRARGFCGNNQPFGRRVPAALSWQEANHVVWLQLMQLFSTSAGPSLSLFGFSIPRRSRRCVSTIQGFFF